MKRPSLSSYSVDDLVRRFTELALQQDDALLGNELSAVKRLYWKLEEIGEELKGREGDARRALARLYDHPNAQVRLKAVQATFAVLPDEAMKQLQAIADSKEYPQAGEAGMALWLKTREIDKPT